MQSRLIPLWLLVSLTLGHTAPIADAAQAGDLTFHVGEEGFISAWLTLGPFVQPRGRSLTALAALDPLKAAEIDVPPRRGAFLKRSVWEATYSKKKSVSFTGKRPAIIHLAAVLETDTAGRFLLATGSDGPISVWLNGERVLYRDAKRKSVPDSDLTPLRLSEGANLIIIKLASDRPGRWRLFARLMTADFTPADRVTIRLPGAATPLRRVIEKTGVVAVTRKLDLAKGAVSLAARVVFPGARPVIEETALAARFIGVDAPPPVAKRADAFNLDIGTFLFDKEGLPAALEVRVGSALLSARTGLRMRDVKQLASVYENLKTAEAREGSERTSLESLAWRLEHLSGLVEAGDEDTPYLTREIGNTVRMARLFAIGDDPYYDRRAQVQRRGYRSRIDGKLHYYALYVPPMWREESDKRFGLVVALHGLNGTPMKTMQSIFGRPLAEDETKLHKERYPQPIDGAPFFVVTPEGFGSSGYMAFGEQDVLEVLEQVTERYRIDADRIYVTGASMGGIGAASLPLHFPDRFAAAAPLCGYHSQFVRSGLKGLTFTPWERFLLEQRSNAMWAANGRHLPLYLVHGTEDSPIHSRVLANEYRRLKYAVRFDVLNAGHNVWDETYRNRGIFKHFRPYTRVAHPRRVTFRTASLRYRGAHWLRLDDLEDWGAWAFADAEWREDNTVRVTTKNVDGLTLRNDDTLSGRREVRFDIDGQVIAPPPGVDWQLKKTEAGWSLGRATCEGYCKRPGLAGPIRDALYEPLLFVYGTGDKAEETLSRRLISYLRRPLAGVTVDWPVKADREVTDADMENHSLVLVGTPKNHRILQRIANALPVRVDGDRVTVGERQYAGDTLSAAFIHPNPLNPERYVVVHTGTSPSALFYADHLPDIVPDYVVYDGTAWQWKRGKVLMGRQVLTAGFFDERWRVRNRTGSTPPGK